ncbi:hypothetical protein QYE76_055918 [Lolium multiflorum]|uniref:F-box domain-containing protein n=1 Tax=Lolium multiflorum TaxID=4521 RepID=A0AAD8T166_LOLMU|nr:hypothetical protein QYE76_055918 [Lolium multiflorum]
MDSSWDLPTDALVEILVRLPPNARRRLRLVCKHWRELIEQRMVTDMRRRTKIIAVSKGGFTSIIDLLTSGSSLLWPTESETAQQYSMMSIIGSCNGLVCLCDDTAPGGAITVANPSTTFSAGDYVHGSDEEDAVLAQTKAISTTEARARSAGRRQMPSAKCASTRRPVGRSASAASSSR